MVGPQAKTRTVEDDRTPYWCLSCFELSDDLSQADGGIFFRKDVGKVDLGRFEELGECPGSTAAFIKNIVDFAPGGADQYFIWRVGGLSRRRITCEISVDSPLSYTGRKAL